MFLAGRWHEYDGCDRPLPRWAWLNQAAHADLDILRATAARQAAPKPSSGDAIQATLARAVLSARTPHELRRLQQEILIPIELDLMCGGVVSPRRVVEQVTTALFSGEVR